MYRYQLTVGRLHINAPTTVIFILLAWLVKVLNDNSFVVLLADGTLQKSLIDQYFTLRSPVNFDDWVSIFTLFSYVLGHADDLHLYSNLGVIFLASPMVEERLGSIRLALAMVFVAGFTGLFSVIFVSYITLKGSSGIAFMLFTLASFANVKKGYIPITFILACSLYIQTELRLALTHDAVLEALGKPTNVANFSHLLGGCTGALIGMRYLGKRQ